ncbi:MAG: tRNA 2-thiouridine(34) synthase MnmA, partial [Oscillospiraceae bacterium]|nr:tRNA 2-thiouridine(34) synthase MnmA [Oscillospiraceae bacterium]
MAYGSRIYVVGKNGNDVFLGPNEALFSSHVKIEDVNFIPFDALREPIRCEAKLRYTPKTAACTVYPTENGAE